MEIEKNVILLFCTTQQYSTKTSSYYIWQIWIKDTSLWAGKNYVYICFWDKTRTLNPSSSVWAISVCVYVCVSVFVSMCACPRVMDRGILHVSFLCPPFHPYRCKKKVNPYMAQIHTNCTHTYSQTHMCRQSKSEGSCRVHKLVNNKSSTLDPVVCLL